MTSPQTPESGPNPRTVEVLAEHVSNSFSRKWRELGVYEDAYDLGKVNEGEYYRTARAFAKRHGFSETLTRELVNFEIHRGFDIPQSAEFKLLATPVPNELLEHVVLLQNGLSIADITRDASVRLPVHFAEEHASIDRYENANPGLVSRIVLTRTLETYQSIKRAKSGTEDFLTSLHADEFMSQEEVDDIRRHNLYRIAEWKLQLETIEALVADGIKPLSPDEYTAIVEGYLLDLIKHNEDRLNPFSKEDRTALPGTIALQAFFENHTGKKYPGTQQ